MKYWIRVDEKQPKDNRDILVNCVDFFGIALVEVGYYDYDSKVFLTGNENIDANTYITHWMNLPEPINVKHD